MDDGERHGPCASRSSPAAAAPHWNGCVERADRSARIEFWHRCDEPLTVAGVAPKLAEYEFFHNYLRPRTALDYRTPNEYLSRLSMPPDPASQSSERS